MVSLQARLSRSLAQQAPSASWLGLSAGQNRCHDFWKAFWECYNDRELTAERNPFKPRSPQSLCVDAYEDYQECVFHTKEVSVQALVGCVSSRAIFLLQKVRGRMVADT